MSGTNFLTVSQVAEELDVSRQYVQQLIDSDRLKAFWMLERWAIPESEVERFKDERKEREKAIA